MNNPSYKNAMVGSYQDAHIGDAHISIYLDETAVPTHLKYYAEGGINLSKQIFNFNKTNLTKTNFPSKNIFGKMVAEPYSIRIQGYFGKRYSVIGTIRFNNWDTFYKFNMNIYKK